ncbi:DUF4123 domain-containing protein [Paraburkholderia aspalathi]|uniref:DUF4123 domain-containing protein n=1 Tax=Paraburkholderia aspalathi TaxID=1324617 RepID=UPI0038B89787
MDFNFENHLLERFRAKHAELAASGTSVRLYALIDSASMTLQETGFLYKDLHDIQRKSLYSGSGLATLEQTGPSLLAMPDLRGDDVVSWSTGNVREPGPINLFLRLIRLARHNAQLVSWIWTPHDLEPFIDHLQTLLHARLGPGDDDAWFFFYQPLYLRALHRELPESTRRHVFGPCHAWWMLDMHVQLVELAGESLPIPRAWDAFPVPADAVAALHREVMPLQILAWLRKTKRELFTQSAMNAQLCEIAPYVERALNHGLTRKADMATFVAYGLRYKTNYDTHPAVQEALTGASSVPLIDTYVALGSPVWQQVADTAQQRVEQERAQQWHDSLRQRGSVRMKAQFVNFNTYMILHIRIRPPRGQSGHVQRIGDIEEGSFSRPRTLDVAEVDVPLPGGRIVLEWWQPYNPFMKSERVISGELPRDEKAGMLVVNFYDFEQSVVMYAERPGARVQ